MSDTTDTILADYTAWLRTCTRPKTVDARSTFIASRLRDWGHPATWSPQVMQRYLWWSNEASRKERPEWTKSTYYTHLRDFGRWCEATDVTDTDPVRLVAKKAHPSNLPRPLSDDQVAVVMAAATDRQRAWLLLALHAGLRAHEVAKVRGEDIGADLLYVEGKGRKRAALPTHPGLWQLAQDYPRQGYWFPSDTARGHVTSGRVSASISDLFDRHGIEGSIHRMRHTFGTRLVRQGVDLRRVQTLMRHSSLATTQGYLEVADVGLRDAIHLLPGA